TAPLRFGTVPQLVVAEAVDLMAAESEVAVGFDHGRVLDGVGCPAVVARVVLGAVDFQDDALAVGQQREEVHPEPRQGLGGRVRGRFWGPGAATPPAGGRHVVDLGAEDAVIGAEEVALAGGVVGQTGVEPRAEALRGLVRVGEVFSLLPPGLQVPPEDAVVGDGAVVDQGVAVDDFDVVADRGGEPDVGLRRRAEDDVLGARA
ncbi:hypothetical protein AB1388_24280, partial [Streptomyces hydrogenans]|uniref:hypothetical protein n=1 Tax=Streptomyces hydrogenans TaxID=1873719 RepID=UPI00345D7E92